MALKFAHDILCHADKGERPSKMACKTEAEAVAFVISLAVGLDTNKAPSDYIHLCADSKATFAASLTLSSMRSHASSARSSTINTQTHGDRHATKGVQLARLTLEPMFFLKTLNELVERLFSIQAIKPLLVKVVLVRHESR